MTDGQPNKPLKILYIVTQGELGGAQRYVHDLAVKLSKDFQITAAMGKEKTKLGDELVSHAPDVKVKYLTHLVRNINPFHDILALFEIKKLIKDEKPDIVHLNSSKAGALGSVAGRLAGNKNIIFTAHGLAFLEPKPWPVRQLYYWAERMAMPFRKKVITVSEWDKKMAIKYKLGKPEKFITIHNGIEGFDMLPRETARKKLNLQGSEAKIIIGTIAHNYKTKDLPTLKKAFAFLKQDYPNTKLVIIGRGSPYGEIPEARQLLPAFDIYVSSSVKEGFPYSILEAATAGAAIVATKVGGIPEALEHNQNALLVEPSQPKLLAGEIEKLIKSEKLRKQLGSRAKEGIKKFTTQEMVNQTVKIYESLANG